MFKRIFGKNFEYWILLPTFVPNKINLIKMNYNSEINFANKTNFNIVRKDAYANKYGETIDMIETQDGDVYFKHEDFHNQFIKFDDLVKGGEFRDNIKLIIIMNLEEKKFVCNFLMGTKYDYLIPHIMNQSPY